MQLRSVPRCVSAGLAFALIACSGSPRDEGDAPSGAAGSAQDGGRGPLAGDRSTMAQGGSRANTAIPQDGGRDTPPELDGGRVTSTQGDAPAGHCPGVPVRTDEASTCWDSKPGSCFACVSPLGAISACSGVMHTPPGVVAICRDDSDCARPGTRCEPGHVLANEQGCRSAGCDEGAKCPEYMLCDPSSPFADPPALGSLPESAPVVGCRPVMCDDPGGPSCNPQLCEPSHASASLIGCHPRSCDASSPCPDGQTCTGGACTLLPCNAPGAAACEPRLRCSPSGSCVAIHCSEPGGFVCLPGTACDPASKGMPGHGCQPIPCDQPGATPCPDATSCLEVSRGVFSCVECLRNEDCGCGSCIKRKCYDRPGTCQPTCG
jgi:hypothetical protein